MSWPEGERVVFMPESTAFGGGERVLLALSRHLYQSSVAHRFAWYFDNVSLANHASWPIQEESLNPRRSPLKKIQALNRLLRAAQAANSGSVLLVGIQAALHVSLCGPADYSLMILDTPSLLSGGSGQGSGGGLRRSLSRPLIRRAMRRARTVIATTNYMAEEIRSLYGREAVVVRQGAPAGSFMPRYLLPREPLRVLSVCRLESSKRVDWILEALAALKVGGKNAVVADIVGAGAEDSALRSISFRLGLSDSVVFHGRVDDLGLERLYSKAHIFLMPARQGYGLPALEALSRGIPVVCHRDSGVSEILAGTPWVELLSGDAEGLVNAVQLIRGRILSGELIEEPLPKFPTEDEWAEAVCRECGWI